MVAIYVKISIIMSDVKKILDVTQTSKIWISGFATYIVVLLITLS